MWHVSSRCHYYKVLSLNFHFLWICCFHGRAWHGDTYSLLLKVWSVRLCQMVSFRINAFNMIMFTFVFLAWINNFLMRFNKKQIISFLSHKTQSLFFHYVWWGLFFSCQWGGSKCGPDSWAVLYLFFPAEAVRPLEGVESQGEVLHQKGTIRVAGDQHSYMSNLFQASRFTTQI